MKKLFLTGCLYILVYNISAQELYVNTEPASNMATGSIGFRVLTKLYRMNHNNSFSSYRIEPEVMIGVSKNWMIHVAGYGSNMFQKQFRAEGGSIYAKYRFLSFDDVHKHFRLSAYSKIAFIDNPQQMSVKSKEFVPDGNGGTEEILINMQYKSDEFDIDGNNSGIVTGIVATKLVNKLAASGSVSYGRRFNNLNNSLQPGQPANALNYTASLGYLLLPKNYTNYNQTNVNIYGELLCTTFPGKNKYYVDVAPAVQFIFNSISRLDISYRAQVSGNSLRLSNSFFMFRFEHNLLNVF